MTTQIKDTAFFTVQAWMVTKLGLKTVERDIFAIIYGFSQDEESDFHGSLEYLSQLTGYSRNSICTALKSLTDKQLIIKTESETNHIKSCRYRTSHLYAIQATCTPPIQATCTPQEEGVQATCTNNKEDIKKQEENNKKDRKDSHSGVNTVIEQYHELCFNLPKVRALTDKRKKAILNILKKHTEEEIIECFKIANESSFLVGDNDRGWKADFDFLIREDKFVNILEGKYGGRKKIKNTVHDIEHMKGLSPRAIKGSEVKQYAKF